MDDQQPPTEYISYNGLGRNPMVAGIPYMAGLCILVVFLLGGMLLGVFVGGAGWLFTLLGVPIGLFIRMLCQTDDKAIDILLLEAKWTLIKFMSGNADFHGGTLTIAPITYGRRIKDTKRYFKKIVHSAHDHRTENK
jgi:type IV secretion system protein VirB3